MPFIDRPTHVRQKVGAPVFVLAIENYRVTAEVGPTDVTLSPVRVVLDTADGPNCIARSTRPRGWNEKTRPAPDYQVFDANGLAFHLSGGLKLVIQVRKFPDSADFLVFERL